MAAINGTHRHAVIPHSHPRHVMSTPHTIHLSIYIFLTDSIRILERDMKRSPHTHAHIHTTHARRPSRGRAAVLVSVVGPPTARTLLRGHLVGLAAADGQECDTDRVSVVVQAEECGDAIVQPQEI